MFWCFWCKLTLGKTATRRAVSKYSRSFKLHRQYFTLARISEFSCSWIVRHRMQEKKLSFRLRLRQFHAVVACAVIMIMTKKKMKHVQSWCFAHKLRILYLCVTGHYTINITIKYISIDGSLTLACSQNISRIFTNVRLSNSKANTNYWLLSRILVQTNAGENRRRRR